MEILIVGVTANNFYFYENNFLKRFTNLYIAIGGGLLLWAAWPASPLTLLIFFAWLPLLWLESKVESRKKFFALTYITMFIWNVSATWWIWNASAPGAVSAFLANSLLMCFPWLGFKIAKKWLGEIPGYISLIAFWMCFEYIHLQDWGLSWPWLTLGNAFAMHPEWIQWYEFTGTSGGTLWVLLVNILLFLHLKSNFYREGEKTYRNLLAGMLTIAIPVSISIFAFKTSSKKESASQDLNNIVIVQPNIDPYEKVSDAAGSFEGQLQKLIAISESKVDDNTALIVWPETALYMGNGIDEGNMKSNMFLDPFWSFLKRHPRSSLFTGIESYRMFDAKTKYSREFSGQHFETYNGSVLLDSNGASSFYHKSMLVPGVETLPWFLRFIDKWFEKFGGTTAGYAKQTERTVLAEKNGFKIAPSICYESIYGEFMSKYVRNGANLICIVTNDGWWKKTPGHKQHMNYARLRAIETRTWVARSANTGISCFIDPYGKVIDPQPYNTASAIKLSIPANVSKKTFFVRYGDILSRIMITLSILLLAYSIYLKIRQSFFKKKFPALQANDK
ncbi:MAG: apolipoprotein N-acyltransferase [Chitinophagaceae bacterium]|nr:apolipoprotein N-acyltransferase [Chitinophagaceae bacterium]